jgi:hypothetical protein
VTFYPFLLMDVPPDNGLPDPWGAGEQPAFPWRGRITVHPAPGQPGSPDGSAAAADEIAGFVGTATAADFDVDGDRVRYTGVAEWSLRRMILHYAHLCAAAGGVDAFLIGSELIGLTTVRSARRAFPFVDALKDLAADVSDVLPGSTLVSYAADWSEFFGHRPGNGSGDHLFHLDKLWASPDVDFVGIDVYWPLADWRDGDHLDAAGGALGLRSGLSRRQCRGRRGVRLVLPRHGGAAGAGARRDHRRHARQALGVPLQGPARLVVAFAL